MIFYDTETVGFHGLAVLIQYAIDDGPITLHNVWKEPVGATLDLIEEMMEDTVVGFNLAFDHFHLSKLYSVFSMLDRDMLPEDNIEFIARIEPEGRLGPCVKPKAACDLMLHARKGPYQSLMDRKDIVIRRVPTVLAYELRDELERSIELDNIYFGKRKDKYGPKWRVYDIERNGVLDPHFKDIKLKFHAAGGLKNLAVHALGKSVITFNEIGVDKAFNPKEEGFAPFAMALGKPGRWNWTWPDVIEHHISFWAYNSIGKQYATADVEYTRDLFYHFQPDIDDNDSTLACAVGAVRWRGFKIDIDALKERRLEAIKVSKSAPKAPNNVKRWLTQVMDEIEQLAMTDNHSGNLTTKKPVLEVIANWENHPAAERAKAVLDARKATKEVELYDKLIMAGRFHASFVVIGTLSSRMAGSDGLNPQGINHKTEVRICFTLADDGFVLTGGDFDSFEVNLADAVYNDAELRKTLKSGKKIHALFAMEIFPGKTYDEICATKGKDPDLYLKGKGGVFAMIYGGDHNTLVKKQGVEEEVAIEAFNRFQTKYAGVGESRKRIYDKFCSMRQPKGIGSNVEWHEPADYIESFLGFRRYFTLENKICKALFRLASNLPEEWKWLDVKVVRRDRQQSAGGAVMSALYAAAFQIQASNMRAAANHEIQSPGAQITKDVQRSIWDIQPHGANEWVVVPLNIHDEVLAPTKIGYEEKVKDKVLTTVEKYRDRVPLIEIGWSTKLDSWADK